jgi:hypothetical protein
MRMRNPSGYEPLPWDRLLMRLDRYLHCSYLPVGWAVSLGVYFWVAQALVLVVWGKGFGIPI